MKYVSSYYRKQEEGAPGAVSLLLQHVKCGKIPVCLACVCKAEEPQGVSYPASQLLEWFYKTGIRLCAGGDDRNFRRVKAGLRAMLEEWEKRPGDCAEAVRKQVWHISGILCAGARFLLFYHGKQRIYVINTKFLRPHLKCLASEADSLCMESGILEPGIGILLATESFFDQVTEEMVRECLAQRDLCTQTRADKHLWELGETARARWEENAEAEEAVKKQTQRKAEAPAAKGAVLVCVRQETWEERKGRKHDTGRQSAEEGI